MQVPDLSRQFADRRFRLLDTSGIEAEQAERGLLQLCWLSMQGEAVLASQGHPHGIARE